MDKEVVGKLGEGYSDTLRAIIMNWLGEQGYLAKGRKVERKATEEIDLLDTMRSSLVELLEEKGIITEEEWEKSIKRKS